MAGGRYPWLDCPMPDGCWRLALVSVWLSRISNFVELATNRRYSSFLQHCFLSVWQICR